MAVKHINSYADESNYVYAVSCIDNNNFSRIVFVIANDIKSAMDAIPKFNVKEFTELEKVKYEHIFKDTDGTYKNIKIPIEVNCVVVRDGDDRLK